MSLVGKMFEIQRIGRIYWLLYCCGCHIITCCVFICVIIDIKLISGMFGNHGLENHFRMNSSMSVLNDNGLCGTLKCSIHRCFSKLVCHYICVIMTEYVKPCGTPFLCVFYLHFSSVCVAAQRKLWRTHCNHLRRPTSPSPSPAFSILLISYSLWAATTCLPMMSWTASSRP